MTPCFFKHCLTYILKEDLSLDESMNYLRQALKQYHLTERKDYSEAEHRESKELGKEQFINTVVSPDIVQMIAQKLVTVTKPSQ